MTDGVGEIITKYDEEGNDLPFLTTDEILKQLMKFGFYITYDVKSNLPSNVISLLQSMYELGYDKINKILVRSRDNSGHYVWRPKVVVMFSDQNTDIITYGAKITRTLFDNKLESNSIMNLTDKEDMNWDWLTYVCNISDILDENIDTKDYFETETDVEEHVDLNVEDLVPEGYTIYTSPEEVVEGDDNGTE